MKLIGDGVGRRIERCLLIPRGERQGRRERKGLSSLTQCENGVKADKELLHLAVIKVRAKVFFSGRDNVAQVNTIFSLLPSCLQPCQELWWGKQREKREKRAWASPRQLQPTNCTTSSLILFCAKYNLCFPSKYGIFLSLFEGFAYFFSWISEFEFTAILAHPFFPSLGDDDCGRGDGGGGGGGGGGNLGLLGPREQKHYKQKRRRERMVWGLFFHLQLDGKNAWKTTWDG